MYVVSVSVGSGMRVGLTVSGPSSTCHCRIPDVNVGRIATQNGAVSSPSNARPSVQHELHVHVASVCPPTGGLGLYGPSESSSTTYVEAAGRTVKPNSAFPPAGLAGSSWMT